MVSNSEKCMHVKSIEGQFKQISKDFFPKEYPFIC